MLFTAVCLCSEQFGIPVHEIGHALGLWHEQQRSDRDSYVRVNWGNIHYSFLTQFEKKNTHNLAPYNHGSLMHYPPRVRSKVCSL